MSKTFNSILTACLLGFSLNVLALDLKPDAPDRYTVVKGDTLWGISGKFTDDPWQWPEIWYQNNQIENPHLIFPGDIIGLVNINGERRLTVLNRGEASRTVKLQPTARIEPIESAIPAVPQDAIRGFLRHNQITTKEELAKAPRVIAGREGRVMMGAGDKIYARGNFPKEIPASYGIFRGGSAYIDPKTREVLGLEAQEVGKADVVDKDGDILTLELTATNQQVAAGDVLLPIKDRKLVANYFPKAPEAEIKDGVLLAVSGGVSQIGQYDVVVINRGEREGLEAGHVLQVNQLGAVVYDRVAGEKVRLPSEKAGTLMVFRTYEKMSYGLIMRATQAMRVGDRVVNP